MGHEGFEKHLTVVQAKYIKKAEVIQRAAEKHLTGLVDWAPIRSGMFMWLTLKGITNADDILPALQDAKVIVVPGEDQLQYHCPLLQDQKSQVAL